MVGKDVKNARMLYAARYGLFYFTRLNSQPLPVGFWPYSKVRPVCLAMRLATW